MKLSNTNCNVKAWPDGMLNTLIHGNNRIRKKLKIERQEAGGRERGKQRGRRMKQGEGGRKGEGKKREGEIAEREERDRE